MHRQLAATLDAIVDGDPGHPAARPGRTGTSTRPRWPAIVLRTPEGLDRAEGRGRPAGGGDVAGAPGADRRRPRPTPSTWPQLEEWLRSYRPEELFDADGALAGRAGRARPARPPADERQPARQRRPAAARPRPARLPRLRGRRSASPAPARRRGHPRARRLAAGRDRAQPVRRSGCSARTRPPPTGLHAVFEATDRAFDGRDRARRRPPGAGRPGDGGAVGAPVPGLARGLPAHRPARPVQLLRGVHPHRRLDVQPARQVAEGDAGHPVAAADRLAELPAVQPRLAAGPQRLLAPGPRLHRPRGEQEGRGHPGLPAAGRELPAVGGRPLPAQPALRQRDRGRQAAAAALAGHGRGDHPLHPGRGHLGVGVSNDRRASRTS